MVYESATHDQLIVSCHILLRCSPSASSVTTCFTCARNRHWLSITTQRPWLIKALDKTDESVNYLALKLLQDRITPDKHEQCYWAGQTDMSHQCWLYSSIGHTWYNCCVWNYPKLDMPYYFRAGQTSETSDLHRNTSSRTAGYAVPNG